MQRDIFNEGGEVAQRLIVATVELAGVFGVSQMAISKWKKAGMPQISRGRFDLGECVRWRMGSLMDKAKTAQATDNSDERTQLVIAQTQRAKLETDKLRGELISRNVAESLVFGLASIFASELDALVPRAVPRLLERPERDPMSDVLIDECRHIRESLAGQIRQGLDGVPVDTDGADPTAATKKRRQRVGRRKSNASARAKPGARALAN